MHGLTMKRSVLRQRARNAGTLRNIDEERVARANSRRGREGRRVTAEIGEGFRGREYTYAQVREGCGGVRRRAQAQGARARWLMGAEGRRQNARAGAIR